MKNVSIRNLFIAIVALIGVSVFAGTQTVETTTNEIKQNVTGADPSMDSLKPVPVSTIAPVNAGASQNQTSVVLALNEDVPLAGEADRYNLLVFSKSLAHAEALENINKIKNRGYRPANMNESKAFTQFMNASPEIKDMVLTEYQTMIIARSSKDTGQTEKSDKKTASNTSDQAAQRPAKNGS